MFFTGDGVLEIPHDHFSGGGHPRSTLESLDHVGIDPTGLRSKAIDEFEGQPFHYVITLCDKSSEGGRQSHWPQARR